MSDLAVYDKLDSVAFKPGSRFMAALVQALPQHSPVLAPALVRQAITIIKNSATLQKCSEWSLFSSIAEVSQAGLSLDVHLGQCYLVPFAGTCTVIYGYRGLIELARRSGQVDEIVGEIRYEKDHFKMVLGTDRRIEHEPFDGPESKRGAFMGAYAICAMTNGSRIFEYMTAEAIEKIKNAVIKRKKSDKTSVWETENEGEMRRKTPIRRLAKRLPQSPAMMPFIQAAIRDEYRQEGIHKVVDMPALSNGSDEPVPMAQILKEAEVIEEPPMKEVTRATTIKEKPKAEQVEEAKGPITSQQFDQLYGLIPDLGLTMEKVICIMRKMGHKGAPREFPAAKFKALIETMRAK